MIKVILITLFICLNAVAYSQIPEQSAKTYRKFDSGYRPKGARMKKIGSYMIIVGAGLLIGGVAKIASADKTQAAYINQYGTTSYLYTDPDMTRGALMILGGIALTTPGIILYSIGRKRSNADMKKFTVNVSPANLSFKLKI